jgi:hypothetical protein
MCGVGCAEARLMKRRFKTGPSGSGGM